MRIFTFLSILGFASAFVPRGQQLLLPKVNRHKAIDVKSTSKTTNLHMSVADPTPAFMLLRGGGVELIKSSLQSGPYGVVSLWAIASTVVVPLTIYRQGYSFSVGYGFSVMAMAISLWKTFGPLSGTPLALVAATAFYGFRLGSFLLLRELSVKSKAEQIKTFDKTPRLKRIPFAASVALFYAFMTTPALYTARATVETGSILAKISLGGTILAWSGAVLEAVADGHKFLVKRGSAADEKSFGGPTGGVYQICRHPNYLGEVVFWLGLLIGGAPSFGESPIAWICSLLGFYGIYGIMTNATKRLDEKQAEKYKGQEKYESWKSRVKAPIFPFSS